MDRVDANDPTYLFSLYRYATGLLGDSATFDEIADVMTQKSAAEQEHETININRLQLLRWFHKKGGKEKSCIEKPYLSNQQKVARLEWSQEMLTLLESNAVICYLDEKWFYTSSRRRSLKYLPKANFEAEGADKLKVRKVISRRHSLKTMFITVVSAPNEEHDFDGKIFIERISNAKTAERTVYRQQFHYNRDINQMLKDGEWRILYPENDPTLTLGEFQELIADNVELDDDVREYLTFRYETYTARRKKRIVDLLEGDSLEG